MPLGSVADPHHLDADPDPDPASHFDADPDPTVTLMSGAWLPNKGSKP